MLLRIEFLIYSCSFIFRVFGYVYNSTLHFSILNIQVIFERIEMTKFVMALGIHLLINLLCWCFSHVCWVCVILFFIEYL